MFRLILRSGVVPCNDNAVGVFTDRKTAYLVAELLMALDRCEHPEYSHFEVSEVGVQ
jgi:hypothetical protein